MPKQCEICKGQGFHDTGATCTHCKGIGKEPPIKRCGNCQFWTRRPYDWVDDGYCTGLTNDDAVEIELKTGWDGGYVSGVITMGNFYCRNYRKGK